MNAIWKDLLVKSLAWGILFFGSANLGIASDVGLTDVNDLVRIEAGIKRVVREKTSVVVSVTDGIGFGSGVVVSASGLVLTAGHVLSTGGNQFRVIFPDGRELKAKPLGKNLNVDAGMVQILEPGPWEYAEIGDMTSLQRGDWVVCMGHSGGYELGRKPPVRAGRIIKFEDEQIVTDCVLIGGDSGGPLFDLQGRVVGIHSSIGNTIAENRHVSIATFKKHWKRMEGGEFWGELPELADEPAPSKPAPNQRGRGKARPSMGIRVDRVSTAAKILLVHPGGAAEAAGFIVGDTIETFDGEFVSSSQHLIDLIASRRPGDRMEVAIRRNGIAMVFEVVLKRQK